MFRSNAFLILLVIIPMVTGIYFGARRIATGRWTKSSSDELIALANSQQQLVGAIDDYQIDNGMLPQQLSDLVPKYRAAVPQSPLVRYEMDRLFVYGNGRETFGVRYDFRPGHTAWYVGDDRLPLEKPVSTQPILDEKSLIAARSAEYDRRIAVDRSSAYFVRRNFTEKIAYLVSLDLKPRAIDVCLAAEKTFPQWWRPRASILWLTPPEQAADAERGYRIWVDGQPTFLRYWYLCRYFRDRNRPDAAVAALRLAVNQPTADDDADEPWSADGCAFDAAAFACQQRQPELVLAILAAWVDPYQNDNLFAFGAAAELAQGRFDLAKTDIDRATEAAKTRGLWTQNLDQLKAAVDAHDRNFIYDPGKLPGGEWALFSRDE